MQVKQKTANYYVIASNGFITEFKEVIDEEQEVEEAIHAEDYIIREKEETGEASINW